MTKGIVLRRRIDIRGWRTIGVVAKAQKRRELEPVLLRALETGRTDADDISGHLLFDRSRKVVAERLLHICNMLDLLEREGSKYFLTEEGEKALETGMVFVPEHGAWSLWMSEDDLLESPLLRVDAWEETEGALAESPKGRENRRTFEELPDWVCNVEATFEVPPASGDGLKVFIDELEGTAEAAVADADLNLIWNVEGNGLHLKGHWEGKTVDSSLEAPEMAPERVWDALLDGEALLDDWDRRRGALRVSFGDTTEEERKCMSRDLQFRHPSVPGHGEFEPLELPGIAIAARSHDDAREWSSWRLIECVRDFATTPLYAEWCKEAAAPFAEHGPELPTRAELAASEWNSAVGRPSPRAWRLMAAEDWNL